MIFLKDIVPAAQNNIDTQFILLAKGKFTRDGETKTCLALVADETAAVHFQLWGVESDAFQTVFSMCSPLLKKWMRLGLIDSIGGCVGFTCCYLRQEAEGLSMTLAKVWANSGFSPDISHYILNEIEFTVILVTKDEKLDIFVIYVFDSGYGIAGYIMFLFFAASPVCYYSFTHSVSLSRPPLLQIHGSSTSIRIAFYKGTFIIWELVDYANKLWAIKYSFNLSRLYPDFKMLEFQFFTGAAGDKACLLDVTNLCIMLLDSSTEALHLFSLPYKEGVPLRIRTVEVSVKLASSCAT